MQNNEGRGRRVTGTVPASTVRTLLTVHPRTENRAVERIVSGGKVLYFPAPNGAVRIIGLSDSGEWIAEFACREADFDESYVRRMEQHVARKAGVTLAVI